MGPPYYTEGQRVFSEYGSKTFSHDDLIRLSESARKWANTGCRVVNAWVGDTQLINVSLGYPDEVTESAGRIRDLVF